MLETIFSTNQDICVYVCVKHAEYVPESWSGVVGVCVRHVGGSPQYLFSAYLNKNKVETHKT